MSNSESLVDIVMATYNGERYIAKQIESIQNQSYKNWRLLISDDCSTDQTLKIVRDYAENDHRVQIVSEGIKYGGAMANFMSAIKYSDATYFMFSDQDDIWNEDKIELSIRALIDLEDAWGSDSPSFVSSDLSIVDDDLNLIASSFMKYENFEINEDSLQRVLVENTAWGCTIAGNRKLRELLSLWRESDCPIMHDWLVNLICKACGHSAFIEKPTILYRQHAGQEAGAHKFSLISLLQNYQISKSREYWHGIRLNAKVFLDIYSDQMPMEQRKTVEDFLSIFEFRPIKRLWFAVSHGFLPTGITRRMGQALVFILTPSSFF